jgi:hypothetical protein
MAYSSLILKSLSVVLALRTDVRQPLSGSVVPWRAFDAIPHCTETAQKERAVRARLSGLGSTRNRSRSATRDPTRRKPRRNAWSKSNEFAARAVTPYAKAAKVSPDGLCVEFLHGGALRRSVIERGASCCLDALPQLGAGCVASVSGQRSPIVIT